MLDTLPENLESNGQGLNFSPATYQSWAGGIMVKKAKLGQTHFKPGSST